MRRRKRCCPGSLKRGTPGALGFAGRADEGGEPSREVFESIAAGGAGFVGFVKEGLFKHEALARA